MAGDAVPVALFAYARPEHLRRTLSCLRENDAPLIYAFSDGPRAPDKAGAVADVRRMLRAVDWCELRLTERAENLGLGRSIRTGVGEVLGRHGRLLVVEDDLIFVPGAYRYLCAALDRYQGEPSVMSVTGWTHPSVTPRTVADEPYFDGRAECWVWGTWARAWDGMDEDAMSLLRRCTAAGIDVYRYGADLHAMAEVELEQNIWAVRFLYLHLLKGGLCLRPPWSMVEHIGFTSAATNATDGSKWSNPPLRPCPAIPTGWPAPVENLECAALWQKAVGAELARRGGALGRARRLASRLARAALHGRGGSG